MPDGTCDPASRGQQWNTDEMAVDNGNVVITIRWDWDGVSVRPNCDGPLIDVRVVNGSTVTYYANLPGKKRGARNIAIPPGTDTTYAGNQLRQAGLDTYVDVIGVQLHTDPLALR